MRFTRPLVLAMLASALAGCPGTRPSNLGITNGLLAACPSSPNCVSDRATDDLHKIEPLTYAGDRASAMTRLVDLIHALPRTQIIEQRDDYLYVEFTSAVWRFVDDLELQFDSDGKTIHVRSASRVGYGDLGVNRRRIEDIRQRFQSG